MRRPRSIPSGWCAWNERPGALGGGDRQDTAHHSGGDQVEGQRHHPEAAGQRWDIVRQGQVICELDQNDLLPKLRQARAALGMAEAALKSSRAEYERDKVEALGPDVRS